MTIVKKTASKAKKTRKNLGLEKNTFKKNKRWQLDQDYIGKLNSDEKAFLARFNDEYYGGAVKKNDPDALHNTDKLRKDCYTRNNINNRDTYSILDSGKAIYKPDQEKAVEMKVMEQSNLNTNELEEALVEYLDYIETAVIKDKLDNLI